MLANPKLFKAYDVRGEWNKDWDADFVFNIGKAIASVLKPRVVVLGRDMRVSGDAIFEQLSSALLSSGVDVWDVGLCGTELTYFATSFVPDVDAAVMITASHNPGRDNGLKITLRNTVGLGLSSGLSEIRDAALARNFPFYNGQSGILKCVDLWPRYREHVFQLAQINPVLLSGKKIVIDAGNGIGGFHFDRVLGHLPFDVARMCWNPDGNFPNHPADPFQERNVEDLKKRVVEEKALFGVAYDGDTDRVFFVDDRGRYLPGYYLAALLTDSLLRTCPHPSDEIIVHDPRYYWATQDVVWKYNAKAVRSLVGHTLIKQKMRECNSLFSAECSGHIFYRENSFAESTMLTTLLMLKLVLEKGSLAVLLDPFFKQYFISGEMNFIVSDVESALKRFQEKYHYCEGASVFIDDGYGVDFANWRFNVRPSNTQPLLRLNVEAKNSALLHEKIEELKQLISGKISYE